MMLVCIWCKLGFGSIYPTIDIDFFMNLVTFGYYKKLFFGIPLMPNKTTLQFLRNKEHWSYVIILYNIFDNHMIDFLL